MQDNSDVGCLFIIMFILVCLIRCDQIEEHDFQQKTKEIENMIEFNQRQIQKLQSDNDSLRIHIINIEEQLKDN